MKVFIVLVLASMVLFAQATRTRVRDTETGPGDYTLSGTENGTWSGPGNWTWTGTENGTWSGTENGTWSGPMTYSGSGPEKRQEDGKSFVMSLKSRMTGSTI